MKKPDKNDLHASILDWFRKKEPEPESLYTIRQDFLKRMTNLALRFPYGDPFRRQVVKAMGTCSEALQNATEPQWPPSPQNN